MDMIVAGILIAIFIVLPIYWRANMALIMGSLAFGWVLNDVTGNNLLLYARSGLPFDRDIVESVSLVILGFAPALMAVFFSRKSTAKRRLRLLGLMFLPAIFTIAWLLTLASLPIEIALELTGSQVDEFVYRNQEYALWSAGIIFILYIYLTKPIPDKLKKKSKK